MQFDRLHYCFEQNYCLHLHGKDSIAENVKNKAQEERECVKSKNADKVVEKWNIKINKIKRKS